MQMWLYRMSILLLAIGRAFSAEAQSPVLQANAVVGKSMTLVYDININTDKTSAGIEETYNGGTKTVLLKDYKLRIRLVSLMRINSMYFLKTGTALYKVLITKESGQRKYKYSLTPSEWKFYNAKYDSIAYSFTEDSLSILGYNCKKVILSLKNGTEEVTAYYSPQLSPLDKYAEPMFAGIPGLVLRYEHTENQGTISFTASKLSFDEIDELIFAEPTKGYKQKKYEPTSR